MLRLRCPFRTPNGLCGENPTFRHPLTNNPICVYHYTKVLAMAHFGPWLKQQATMRRAQRAASQGVSLKDLDVR